jgi:Fe-S-cluster containining protein
VLTLSPDQIDLLRDAVTTARKKSDALAAIEAIYADVQAAIDLRKPRCDASGRCCRFESFGHRLFVTTLELAAFVERAGEPNLAGWDGTGCPYQVNKLCSVHTLRPFGCRIFFCDPTADDWQQDQYEQFHLRLKQLHESAGVPYLYVEWREALRALQTR